MFSEEELAELEKISKKSEAVQKLFDFWRSAQVDGESAIRIALNNKWLEFSETIKDTAIPLANHQKNEALDSLIDITKLWKGIEKDKGRSNKNNSAEEIETTGQSVADRMANKKREKE